MEDKNRTLSNHLDQVFDTYNDFLDLFGDLTPEEIMLKLASEIDPTSRTSPVEIFGIEVENPEAIMQHALELRSHGLVTKDLEPITKPEALELLFDIEHGVQTLPHVSMRPSMRAPGGNTPALKAIRHLHVVGK